MQEDGSHGFQSVGVHYPDQERQEGRSTVESKLVANTDSGGQPPRATHYLPNAPAPARPERTMSGHERPRALVLTDEPARGDYEDYGTQSLR